MKKSGKATDRGKTPRRGKTGEFKEERSRARSVYADLRRWRSRESPRWHPVRKMRYVFWRMIAGATVTDALREIRWAPSEFWHMLDLKSGGPFEAEYQRAKRLQGRALADSVIVVAEGRDAVTRKAVRRMDKIVRKATRRIARAKSGIERRTLMQQLLGDLRENDKVVMTRNKLQVDSAKWLATKVNPAEFAETSKLAVGGSAGNTGEGEQNPILIQFVGRNGKVVDL